MGLSTLQEQRPNFFCELGSLNQCYILKSSVHFEPNHAFSILVAEESVSDFYCLRHYANICVTSSQLFGLFKFFLSHHCPGRVNVEAMMTAEFFRRVIYLIS